MKKTIGILATLDTKEAEVEYIKNLIEAKGVLTTIVDTGVLGNPRIKADISREEIAEAGGKPLGELIESELIKKETDRTYTMKVMIKGAIAVCKELYAKGKLNGVISLGGSSGTTIGTTVMRELPIGVPKLMVTTRINPDLIDEGDITMMQTPADILGLNKLMRKILAQAAGAIIGMVDVDLQDDKIKPLIGITALGVTTQAVMKIKSLLEEKGKEVIAFHNKSKILDRLVEEGVIDGIIDLTPNELVKIFIMKTLPDREDRLEAAGKKGLPQVIVPGGIDMLIFSTTEQTEQQDIPDKLRNREMSKHGPYVTLVRTNREENEELARIIAERANRAEGSIAIVIPIKGFSARDKKGEVFYNQEIDRSFTKALRNHIKDHVRVLEIDAHINDDEFAKKIVEIFINLSISK